MQHQLNKRNQLSTLPTVAHWITRNRTTRRDYKTVMSLLKYEVLVTSKYGQKRGLEEFTNTFRVIMNLLQSQLGFLARLPRWQQTPNEKLNLSLDKPLLEWKLQGVESLKEKCPPSGEGRVWIFLELHKTSTLKCRQWTLISCLINRFS